MISLQFDVISLQFAVIDLQNVCLLWNDLQPFKLHAKILWKSLKVKNQELESIVEMKEIEESVLKITVKTEYLIKWYFEKWSLGWRDVPADENDQDYGSSGRFRKPIK